MYNNQPKDKYYIRFQLYHGVYKGYISMSMSAAGADPGFQVRGAHLKKIAPSGGRRENFGYFV